MLVALFSSGERVSETASAQNVAGETKVVEADNNSCELNSAYLDYLSQEARANGERVFVVARPGRGETSRPLSLARLNQARAFLILQRNLDPSRVVFAEGERAKDEGRLEFYLGSKLFLVSLAKQNKAVCLTCCEDYIKPAGNGKAQKT
jgi:hypothetical protein